MLKRLQRSALQVNRKILAPAAYATTIVKPLSIITQQQCESPSDCHIKNAGFNGEICAGGCPVKIDGDISVCGVVEDKITITTILVALAKQNADNKSLRAELRQAEALVFVGDLSIMYRETVIKKMIQSWASSEIDNFFKGVMKLARRSEAMENLPVGEEREQVLMALSISDEDEAAVRQRAQKIDQLLSVGSVGVLRAARYSVMRDNSAHFPRRMFVPGKLSGFKVNEFLEYSKEFHYANIDPEVKADCEAMLLALVRSIAHDE